MLPLNRFVKTFTIFLAAVLAGTLVHLQSGGASADETVLRSAGPDRVATAVAASRDHRDGATDALIANAWTFPDALSATALAANLDAPLLLTESEELPEAVTAELERLDVDTVWVLGGPSVISWEVQAELMDAGYAVERIAGETRYETARALALEVGPSASGEVVVSLGHHPDPQRAWPDAVAAGALGASPDRLPMLLTAHDHLPAPTREGIAELDPERVLLVGGEAAVEAQVEEAIEALGYPVERIAGASRWDTSVALAESATARSGVDEQPVVFAAGSTFADALAAGALAGNLGAPLVLVPPTELVEPIDAFLREHADRWTEGVLVGGPAAANDFVAESLHAALNDQPAPEPEPEAEHAGDDGERVVETFEGEASWYGARFHGNQTASGERFDMDDHTAAHRTLPFGTRVRVTNTRNGEQVLVRVNDRGPYSGQRVIDLSRAAAEDIGMVSSGTAWVRGEVLED